MTDVEILESLKSYTCKPEVIDKAIYALHREQQFLKAGYENSRVEFTIAGRRFVVREVSQ